MKAADPQVQERKEALFGADRVVTIGVVLRELLQGFSGDKAQTQIIQRFSEPPLIPPDRDLRAWDTASNVALEKVTPNTSVEVAPRRLSVTDANPQPSAQTQCAR